eukprot:COSAG01_NODE_4959_length_4589_cov_5.348775_1_plen_318_part_00
MHPGSSRAGTGFGQTDVQQESVAAPGHDDAADAYQDTGAAHQARQQQPGSSSSSSSSSSRSRSRSRRTVEVVDDGDVGCTGKSKKRKGGAGRNPSGARSASAAVEAGAPGGEGRRSVDVVDEGDVGCTGKGKKKRGRGGGATAVAAGGAAQREVPSSAGTPPSLVPSDDGGGNGGGDGCDGDEGGGPRQRPMTSPDIHYPAADASAGGADECGMCAPPLCCYRKQVQSTCLQHQCTSAPHISVFVGWAHVRDVREAGWRGGAAAGHSLWLAGVLGDASVHAGPDLCEREPPCCPLRPPSAHTPNLYLVTPWSHCCQG